MTSQLAYDLSEWLRDYYHDAIAQFATDYPDRETFAVDYQDVLRHDTDLADDVLQRPGEIQDHLQAALELVDVPVEADLTAARVAVINLPESRRHYPGEYSPSEQAGTYVAIEGEVSIASDVYSRVTEAAFECQRCGTLTHVPQADGDYQEPHECQGCERQGPFQLDFDRSAFVDVQMLRVQTPPEVAAGAGQEIDVTVEGDLVDRATVGDRVRIAGVLHRRPKESSGQQTSGDFEVYLDGWHVTVEQSDHTDIEITAADRERIDELVSGAEGDPLQLAADSLAPKIHGYDLIKRMAILLMVGGERVVYGDGEGSADADADRGDFHMLLIGDPGTGKSKIVNRVEAVAPKAFGASGRTSREAGITASAVRDDFGDSEWTLKAGTFVKADGGVVAADELDDMRPEVRSSMLEPMSKQYIHVSKAGINARLSTRAAVIAAGNPEHGRFDPYEPIAQQFEFSSALLSRFDLVYTFKDEPDQADDTAIADHVLTAREAAKRASKGEPLDDAAQAIMDPPVAPELLTKWIALAKRQPAPTFASEAIFEKIRDTHVEIRGANGYDEGDPIPVTHRKLEAVVRIAEAAAKFELSETIEERHADIALEAVGESIQDVGKNKEGDLDADIQEVGQSLPQRKRIRLVEETIQDLDGGGQDGVAVGEVVETLSGDLSEDDVHRTIDDALSQGYAIEPTTDHVRWLGRH